MDSRELHAWPQQGVPLTDNEPRPRLAEMLAIIALAAVHVLIELTLSITAARIYNVFAVLLVLGYLVRRAALTEGLLRDWGMRRDNFWPSLGQQLFFAVPAGACLTVFGTLSGATPLPPTFWLICALYPLWGIAQQFALQNLLAANLAGSIRNDVVRALTAALLFSLSHLPRADLSALAFVGGFFLTLIYQRRRNLWAAGLVHGVLAAMAFYLILGKDPGAVMLEFLGDRMLDSAQ